MRKTKIAFVTFGLGAGGRERQIVSLLHSIAFDENYSVELILLSKQVYFEEVFDLPIKIHFLNSRKVKSLRNYSVLYRLIKKSKPDIVHACDEYAAFYILPISKILKVPFINASLRHGRVKLHIRHIIRKMTYWFSQYIIANSHAGLHANGLKAGKKRIVLYNVIEKRFFENENQKEPSILNEKLNWNTKNNNNEYVFLSVSRLHQIKDYETVLKALFMLKDNFSFIYLIAGEGPDKHFIESKIAQYELADKVFLVGATKSTKALYDRCDVFIHSSLSEGCPNVVLEAMLFGKPVVASDVGGTREVVKDNENGLLFPAKSPELLAEKLKYLLGNNQFRNELGKRAEVYVLEKHNSIRIGGEYLSFIEKIV